MTNLSNKDSDLLHKFCFRFLLQTKKKNPVFMETRFVLNRVSEWHHCYFWTKCEEPDSNSPVLLQLTCGLSILVTGIVVMGKGVQEGHGIVSVTQSGSQFKV